MALDGEGRRGRRCPFAGVLIVCDRMIEAVFDGVRSAARGIVHGTAG